MTDTPSVKCVKPLRGRKKKRFQNRAERRFAWFCTLRFIWWRYEPHFWMKLDSSLPKGHNEKGHCPDFYLRKYDVYVEIHGGEKSNRSHRQLTPKRKKIRWLSSETGKAVVLIHYSNWPTDKEDFERLVKRAKDEAAKIRQEFLESSQN